MTQRASRRSLTTAALSVVVSLCAGSSAFADVRFSMHDGQVSLVATDATVAEILAEWARVGRTLILNTDRIAPDRMTLDLQNVSEQEALEIVLRVTGGYLAVWRAVDVPSGSSFDRIVVMPRGVAPIAANRGAPPADTSAAEPRRADAQADIVVAQAADGDAPAPPDEPVAVSLAGAVPIPTERSQVSLRARHALEVVDPRQFQMPATPGGVNGPRAGPAPSGGVPVPGMIVRPRSEPDPPRVPSQLPTVRK